eukprot:TRINITY_DN74109_c0_g1_i1.p1 TRINITY_DN74109_c0_g1~~TRINITY_DN74109_c0_g1_i1.p1  ORF type:complete len:638 (-),score=205.19 TRINITY_DN74109_c0_g1_i1:76-1989(-)
MATPKGHHGQSDEDRQAMEVAMAQMENRLRGAISDLVQPTISRVSIATADIDTIKGIVTQHTRTLQEVQLGQLRAVEMMATIGSFKEEMQKWDTERKTQESQVDQTLENMTQKLEAQKYSLEQKESALHHLHRCVDRLTVEVNRLAEDEEMHSVALGKRIDEESKKLNDLRTELQVKVQGLEMRHNAISDELWGEETGLAKVGGELLKTNAALTTLEAAVHELHEGKAEAAQLTRLQNEVAKTVHEANTMVADLKQTVGTVVSDVKEHFRTASQTIASYNMAFVTEVRAEYQHELKSASNLRAEVKGFMELTATDISVLRARISEADAAASSLVSEVRSEIEELNRGRKRDKTSSDNELKALKRRLAGVFDNSDMVLKGIEHIYGVMEMMLESDKLQNAVELQDSTDRKRIALMGVKDDETVMARGTQNEPQYPRPECRAKTAPGGIKGRPHLTAEKGIKSGALSARTSAEPVIKVDNRCLGCSGQAPFVLSAFKMACLQYTSSPVDYNGSQQDRDELLKKRSSLLLRAHSQLKEGPVGGGSGGSAAGSRPMTEGTMPPGSAQSDRTVLNRTITSRMAPMMGRRASDGGDDEYQRGRDALAGYATVDGWHTAGESPGPSAAAGGGGFRLPNLQAVPA